MNSTIFNDFIQQQHEQVTALAAQSDVFDVHPLPPHLGDWPDKYELHYQCNLLVADSPAAVRQANRAAIGVWLHPGYLRQGQSFPTLSLLAPMNLWHPNVRGPFICLDLPPATPLVDIVYSLYELLTYQKVQLLHGLNPDAVDYARRRMAQGAFPLDRRPLKRTTSKPVTGEHAEQGGEV